MHFEYLTKISMAFRDFRKSMRLAAAALGLAALGVAGAASAQEVPADQVIESLHESLLDVMREADTLGYGGRRNRLAPVIDRVFDVRTIARIATGRDWRNFDRAERVRLVEKMSALTVAIYAARFDGYSGESFRVLSEKAAPRGTVLVNAEIVKSDGEEVRIDYLLRPTRKGWRIVDVYLDGVYSELALKRSEYRSVIKRKGIAGLFAALDDKIADFERDNAN